jgi:hypothetical protein
MNKRRFLGILAILVLLQITLVYAVPQINYFNAKRIYPKHIELSWEANTDDGFSKIELYNDGILFHESDISGTHVVDLYQIYDDGARHTFKIVLFDLLGGSAEQERNFGGDSKPPVVDAPSELISKSSDFAFTTNEKSTCMVGLHENSTSLISPVSSTSHNLSLSIQEGLNRIYIRCTDEEGNIMSGFYITEFTYDKTSPGKVSNLKFDTDSNRLSWDAASDNLDVDHYVISNSFEAVAETQQTYFDVTSNESMLYVHAVDEAGNEGQKSEYNIGRDLLLKSTGPAAVEKETEKETKETSDGPSTISIVAWITFGILLLGFIAWKVYEYKTDRHGLMRYMNKRRRMRSFQTRFKL